MMQTVGFALRHFGCDCTRLTGFINLRLLFPPLQPL